MRHEDADIVVVGAGLAGLLTALKLAPRRVVLLAKAPLGEGASSAWAQGGIAAAVGYGDSAEAHGADTHAVAGGLSSDEVVELVTGQAAELINELIRLGVKFDRSAEGGLAVGQEAAHGRRRILHANGDATGREIMRALIAAVRTATHIQVYENVAAQDLILSEGRAVGVIAAGSGGPQIFPAPAVILASGGIGQLYAKTTNPRAACGDGLAMAARAGAVIADPEFVQFHPTALECGKDPMPLVTEALRGEGAILINGSGRRFAKDAHRDGELAPRDVVARAIWRQQMQGESVYLDARKAIGPDFHSRFPTVYAHCQDAGIDPVCQAIPVSPAVHYHMGGIAVDARGRSSLPGLWACGEAACTGMHGANRLASNSLLEAAVFACLVADDVIMTRSETPKAGATLVLQHPGYQYSGSGGHDLADRIRKIRHLMYENVGLVREEQGLLAALRTLRALKQSAVSDPVEFTNLLIVAKFITVGAWLRRESRGSHFRSDYPFAGSITGAGKAQRTFLTMSQVDAILAEIESPDRPKRKAQA